ncbi:Uncharacterized protein BM_BM228 [Brugia malayi]|uniref:Bm228 n=1 Tax=Brugia malayi TaxID=6279 RepID=A8PI36_BRUMA|nr:Uncharacterized protein BM_BM228 [Brugia malayi]CDP91941.1 Bm228 [Brugia malayi]VIO88596.1 Uncharacterized protein BM_BM228 [Brugia malayi]
MYTWKIIMELFGGFSIYHLIFLANELNAITAGPVCSRTFSEQDMEIQSTTHRASSLLCCGQDMKMQPTVITKEKKLMELLTSLKKRHSICEPQQSLIHEIDNGAVARQSLINYSNLFQSSLGSRLVKFMLENGAYDYGRPFVLEDTSKYYLAKFISKNFMKSCDDMY